MSDIKYRIPNDTVAGARKPGNDMKKNKGLPKMGDSPAMNQRDKGLDFNGQLNGSSQRNSAQKGTANMAPGFSNPDSIQMRQAPNRMGNYSDVNDRTRVPPCQVNNNVMGGFKNPDSINVGRGPTNAGSSRSWMPSAGQNYKGNPDSIQEGQQYNNKGNRD
jgi:hypothetical protein